jgi:hypothetical protein
LTEQNGHLELGKLRANLKGFGDEKKKKKKL